MVKCTKLEPNTEQNRSVLFSDIVRAFECTTIVLNTEQNSCVLLNDIVQVSLSFSLHQQSLNSILNRTVSFCWMILYTSLYSFLCINKAWTQYWTELIRSVQWYCTSLYILFSAWAKLELKTEHNCSVLINDIVQVSVYCYLHQQSLNSILNRIVPFCSMILYKSLHTNLGMLKDW